MSPSNPYPDHSEDSGKEMPEEKKSPQSRRHRRAKQKSDALLKQRTKQLNEFIATLLQQFFAAVEAETDPEDRQLILEVYNQKWNKYLMDRKSFWRYDKLKGVFYERVTELARDFKQRRENALAKEGDKS